MRKKKNTFGHLISQQCSRQYYLTTVILFFKMIAQFIKFIFKILTLAHTSYTMVFTFKETVLFARFLINIII